MKAHKCLVFFALAGTLTLSACSNSSDSNNNNGGNTGSSNRVHWDSIPSEFSPRKESFDLRLQDIQKIKMDLFGFNGDVQFQYSDKMPTDAASIELFTVAKEATYSLSGLNTQADTTTKTLILNKYGSYACSIKIHNRQITELKGACYIRVLLTLPRGSEIEIYNVGQLISRRFIAMDNKTFLNDLDRAPFKEEKSAVIDAYLESYRVTSKTPVLSANELGRAIEEFSFSDEKFTALRKLHAFVVDRENLGKMIEDKFTYFDREKARQIVGLR